VNHRRPSRLTSASAEGQLTLLSAGTAARRQELGVRAQALARIVDWSRLAGTLESRRLLGTLGPRLLELADGRASDAFAAAVGQAIDRGRREGAVLQLISAQLMSLLAQAGIPSAALKGPLLAEAIYGDPGRRASSDIDLLVAPQQLRAAVHVVRRLGYEAPADHLEPCGLPMLHFALLHERGERPPVELHWRIHWYERRFAHERLLPPAADLGDTWRPAPADELASLLLYYARDGFIDLRLASDLGAWWDKFGGSLPAGALDELLYVYPELARPVSVAARVAESVVGLPAKRLVPAGVELGVRGRLVRRLANPNPRVSPPQLYADMGLIDGLLMPAGGFRAFLRRQVLPPRDVLDQRARRAPEEKAGTALGHAARVLGRYVLAITRLARAPVPFS
jgi:hypothetical protein